MSFTPIYKLRDWIPIEKLDFNYLSHNNKSINLLDKNFKSSNLFSKQIISLPVYPKLKNKEIDFVCNSIKQMFNES